MCVVRWSIQLDHFWNQTALCLRHHGVWFQKHSSCIDHHATHLHYSSILFHSLLSSFFLFHISMCYVLLFFCKFDVHASPISLSKVIVQSAHCYCNGLFHIKGSEPESWCNRGSECACACIECVLSSVLWLVTTKTNIMSNL